MTDLEILSRLQDITDLSHIDMCCAIDDLIYDIVDALPKPEDK